MSSANLASSRSAALPGAEPDLSDRYRSVRAATKHLIAPLSAEDCGLQSMEDASPPKWHLAHTTWFFETLVLEASEPGFRPYEPQYRVLFNSYYNSVGEQFARPRRGLLSRPTLDEVLSYREHVDRHVLALLDGGSDPANGLESTIELGLHHEQQHQELLLTDVKHALSHNPLHPAYHKHTARPRPEPGPATWHRLAAGAARVGHDGDGFAFDNEGPAHRAFVEAFEIASRPVTNGEYLDFVADGGYRQPEWWLSDGWATVRRDDWRAPLYWHARDDQWFSMTLSGLRPLRREEPVCHVSFFEADAFARWAGARLPTEVEWETAAARAPVEGNFVESGLLHPAPAGASAREPAQLFGDVWEWTRSPYQPYPGFRPLQGALGEYNGKFMCNQMVLRGGSCATPQAHIRRTYRNFFYPDARWQFSGIRLARDAD